MGFKRSGKPKPLIEIIMILGCRRGSGLFYRGRLKSLKYLRRGKHPRRVTLKCAL